MGIELRVTASNAIPRAMIRFLFTLKQLPGPAAPSPNFCCHAENVLAKTRIALLRHRRTADRAFRYRFCVFLRQPELFRSPLGNRWRYLGVNYPFARTEITAGVRNAYGAT
jgi:hypothetical protein